ncbi:MAG: hypothetical protein NW224_18030 [Leptolyngbyaceae cyanobacterium bins.302]|nr:hypothetical protein [Leptolyngbyaceae cyanobacterium bins.302]
MRSARHNEATYLRKCPPSMRDRKRWGQRQEKPQRTVCFSSIVVDASTADFARVPRWTPP